MSNGRLPKTLRGATLFLLAGLLVTFSCGQVPSLAPEECAPRAEIDIVDLNVPSDLQLQGQLWVTEEIGPAGGTIGIEGFLTIDVPPGAVSDDTEFSIQISNPLTFEWVLTPHAKQFANPVTLTVHLTNADLDLGDIGGKSEGWEIGPGISPDSLEVYWRNGSVWIPQGAVYDADQHAMVVELDHFSRYALATE